MKETKMKSLKTLPRSILLGCIALGTLGLLAPNLTFADGKGASKLMFSTPSQTQAQVASVKSSAMGCPRCTEGYTRAANSAPKGLRAESTKLVAAHMCPTCTTTISSVGSGKAKADQVSHRCGTGASCCMAAK